MIRNGNDCMLVAYDTETNHVTDTTSATSVKAMRQACKNIMYTMVNSYTYVNYDPNHVSTWVKVFYVVDVAGLIVLAGCEVLLLKKRKTWAEA